MKVRALVFENDTKQYKTDQNGKLLEVHAEDAASLKEDYPHKHQKLEYRNTRANPEIRQRLKLVTKNGTSYFSYIGDYDSTGSENVDESESHRAAIIALSRLTRMKFYAPESDLVLDPVTFTEVLVEPMIELANGKKYFPDLLCRFSEDHPLYDRWGGKLAIEVTYSHPCEDSKKHDFMFHNIPILEVVIEKNSSREYPGERYNWDYYALTSIANHTDKLETWFKDYIRVNVLVDPISNRVHEKITGELSKEYKQLKVEKKLLYKRLSTLKETHSTYQKNFDILISNQKDIVDTHNIELQDLKKHFKQIIDKLVEEKSIWEDKIDELVEEKSIGEEKQKQLSDALSLKSTKALCFMIISAVLFLSIVGALIAPIWFRDHAITAISLYFNLV